MNFATYLRPGALDIGAEPASTLEVFPAAGIYRTSLFRRLVLAGGRTLRFPQCTI